MKVDAELCLLCEACIENCPLLAITLDKKIECIVIDNDRCVECGACIESCPRIAIKKD